MLNFPTPGANYRLCPTHFTIPLVGLGFTPGASRWHQYITVTGLNFIWRKTKLKVKPLIWCKKTVCELGIPDVSQHAVRLSWIPTILRAKERRLNIQNLQLQYYHQNKSNGKAESAVKIVKTAEENLRKNTESVWSITWPAQHTYGWHDNI